MEHRLAALALTAVLTCALLGRLTTTAVFAQAATPGLVVPNVVGPLGRGGQFTGNLTVSRLSYRAGQLSADGTITGTVAQQLAPPTASATAPPTSTPASGGSIFAPTATPAPTSELTPQTSIATATLAATATPTPHSTATSTGLAAPAEGDEFPRADLTGPSINQAGPVSQAFRDIPLTLLDPDMGVCDVLHLDLGPVFLDQLGVQLDLAPATVDIQTLPRTSRPLGNMLCAVASLLEGAPSAGQAATLNELLPVVNRTLTNAAAR